MHHLIRNIFGIACIGFSALSFAQDTLEFESIDIRKRRFGLKKKGLYEGQYEEQANVRGFSQLSIFDNSVADHWTSDGEMCIKSKLAGSNETFLSVNWNSDLGECDWVGMGFGWDGWMSKDLGYVIDTLALQMTVRSTGEDFSNIPWAFCFEDYGGGQAWLGYNQSFLEGEKVTSEWSNVTVPLSLFPFDEYDVDASNIKQLLIQVFSSGTIEIKSMDLIPFSGKLRETYESKSIDVSIDGKLNEWGESMVAFSDHTFGVSYSDSGLNIAFDVQDDSPRQNRHKDGKLWDGDAVEIAISTNPKADDKRKFLLLSDLHFAVNCGEEPYVWNYKMNQLVPNCKTGFSLTEAGYSVEVFIPNEALRNLKIEPGDELDLEVAVNLGTYDNRQKQIRWNSANQEGFHTSPALWGTILFK